MYKFGILVLFFVLYVHENQADISASDIINDVNYLKNLLECKQSCAKKDPKHDQQQTCKVFTDKKEPLTDCQVECLKINKDEAAKANICTCVNNKCSDEPRPPPNSAVKYIPEIFSVLFVVYTVNYVI